MGREQLWILRGFEFVSDMGVTSKIRSVLKINKTRSFESYAVFVLVNCTTDLFIVLVIIVIYCLSCIHSELAKPYTAIHERFGHVSHSSLKRVASPDSALFLMSVYKTSHSMAQRFSASLTAWSFLSASRRITRDAIFCLKLSQGDPTA